MSSIHREKHILLGFGLRTAPVTRQLEERSTGRYLLHLIAFGRIVDLPADLAFHDGFGRQLTALSSVCAAAHATSDQYGSTISSSLSAESLRSSAAAFTTSGMSTISIEFTIGVLMAL